MEIEILCINCETMIESDKIHDHSQYCVKPHKSVLTVEKGSSFKLVNFRIEKLKDSVHKFLEINNKTIEKDSYTNFLYLLRQATEIFSVKLPSHQNLSICQSILQGLSNYQYQDNNPRFMIYIERLKVLTKIKLDTIQRLLNYEPDFCDITEETFEKGLKEIEFHADLADTLKNVNYSSFLYRKKFYSTSTLFSSKNQSLTQTEIEGLESEKYVDSLGEVIEEDGKKIFYSMFLEEKLKFSWDKVVNLSEIFKEALALALPITKWAGFIRKKFLESD